MTKANSITIDAGVLDGAIKAAAAVVETRNTIPILANVRLFADAGTLELVATDLDNQFRQRFDLPGGGALATTVHARRFAALVGMLPANTPVTLEPDGPRLIIRAGRSRWVLPTLPADDFPVLPIDKLGNPVAVPGKALAEALRRTVWSVCTEVSRPHIAGPFLHCADKAMRIVATNGHTLAAASIAGDWPADAPEITLGPKFARLLQQHAAEAQSVDLAWDDGKIRATIGAVELTGKTIMGPFPDYSRVVPPDSDRIVLDPALLAEAVKRVDVVADGKTRAVRVERAEDRLTLSSTSPEAGDASAEVPADCAAGSAPVTAFNSRYLAQMMEAIGGDSIEIHQADGTHPALFRRVVADGAFGVIMPMRA